MNFLALDTETTGTDERKHDILTAYFAIYDENLEFLDELDLKLKPDDPNKIIIYDPEAREVTGIDLVEHLKDPATITYSEAKIKLLKFLEKHKIPKKRNHFRYLGQNLDFDTKFIKEHLEEEEGWSKLVHHSNIDTYRICTFLNDCGLIAADVGNLGSLVEYFGVPMRSAHNAKEDVLMCVDVYRAMKKMMEDKKNNLSGVSESDLLSIVEL